MDEPDSLPLLGLVWEPPIDVGSKLVPLPDDVVAAPSDARTATQDGQDDESSYPVLQLADAITAASSTEARCSDEDDSDGERVDQEILVDSPPARVTCDAGPPTTTLAVCRFSSPPLLFQRSRQPPPQRPLPMVPRPRTLGEFLIVAKSRSDALLQTPTVRRRLVELKFQPR
jgi:hypothetical protein